MTIRPKSIEKAVYELLIIATVAVGLVLTIASFFLASPRTAEIFRGLGLSLFPAGLVAFLLSRFASNITELLLREAIDETIRERLGEAMLRVESTVAAGLRDLAKDMKSLSPLFLSAASLGLESLHLTRAAALEEFVSFLTNEIEKALSKQPARIWIVSSSIKGFLEAAAENFDGRRMMEQIVTSSCELRIIMTDPNIADFRAQQEDRATGEIPSEIRMNLAYLKRIGVQRECVRFYPGAPTVFAVATSDRMLLNPYPYQAEAFRCFSLLVQRTNSRSDIYQQYTRHHFEEPWQRAREIPPDEWRTL